MSLFNKDARENQLGASLADMAKFKTLHQLGLVADGVQVDYTFSGTGTTLDGKTRKRWISQSGSATANSNALNQAIIEGYNIIIEKGNWVFDPKVLITLRNNLTIMGSGDDCRVIGWNLQGWNSHLSFEKFMIEGPIDLQPPAQLELGTETWFNNSTMFDIYSDLKFYSYDSGITRSPIGIWIQPQNPATDVPTVENIQVVDVKFKNLQSGMLYGDRPDTDRGFRSNNAYVNNCRTEQIWWHGFGFDNGKNFTVENCKSLNHYCGMVADFSRGSTNATIFNCVAENVVNLTKSESNGTMLPDNHRIINNTFKYINDGQPKYHYRDWFVIKLTADAYVKNNYIELWNTHEYGVWQTSYYSTLRHVEITENRIIFNNALHPNRTYSRPRLFAITLMQPTTSANSNVKVNDNTFKINTTTATGLIYARNLLETLQVEINKVSQTVVSDFIFCYSDTGTDGEVKNVKLANNILDVCSYFLYSVRDFTGKVIIDKNQIDTVSNTLCYIKPASESTNTQNISIINNEIGVIGKLIDFLRLPTFGMLKIRGNQYSLINGLSAGIYFIGINDANLTIDSFIYENNNFIDHSNNSFSLSMRFDFININTTNYTIKEFIVANNHCIMQEYFIAIIGTGTGGNKLRVSNNNVEAKGAMDGRTVQFLYLTGTPFTKGMVANNEIINNYTNTVNVNFYSTYKGLGTNVLGASVTETA